MAGNQNNTVHGWNPGYQDVPANLNAPRFRAFTLNANSRPVQFHNEVVTVVPPLPNGLLDHQSHIVPQNELDRVLQPAMAAAYASVPRPGTVFALDNYLTTNHPAVNWALVTAYVGWLVAQNAQIPPQYFVDTTGTDAEDFYGGYFSVMMWNPVNICRAPDDGNRGRYPGNVVDMQVMAYIDNHPAQAGITLLPAMQTAFRSMPAAPNMGDLIHFINVCNASLAVQQGGAAGYYQFNWHVDPVVTTVLVPGP